jgi:succinate dehydrogenase flavin-adding protein (antitoxin of CptAB toxin-antitoxin module)
MTTSAQRMRARRARLAEQGLAEVSVVWPEHRLDELRELAEAAQHQHERLLDADDIKTIRLAVAAMRGDSAAISELIETALRDRQAPDTLTQSELTRIADEALAGNDIETIRLAVAAMRGDSAAMAACVRIAHPEAD